jgi:hypothetical protein
MMTIVQRMLKSGAVILAICCLSSSLHAQTSLPPATWLYRLLDGSELTDDCPICDHLPFVGPMRGTFEMSLIMQGPLFSTYEITNIFFTAATGGGRAYRVTGQGVYELGGELAIIQRLYLDLRIDNGITNDPCYLSETTNRIAALWPMLREGVDQTNGTQVQQYHLEIAAAPFQEIWFSTASKFPAGIWNDPTNEVSAGDLLSTTGRRVKTNQELAGSLGPMPPVPDLGLKDIDILPGGEIAFSIEDYIFSETLGPLYPGDLLSNKGRILRRNATLIAAFLPQSTPADVGLSAVQVMNSGETWFSVQTKFFSQALGRTISPGDLLSDRGAVIKSNADLIAPFRPIATSDVGLNAIYVWPSGEIWFSTTTGFHGGDGRYFAAGDLLSDQGYLIYSNAELVAEFQPPATAKDLGLDALFIVTDVTPPRPAPVLSSPQLAGSPPWTLALGWKGEGRVFQVEKASNADGPFLPLSPILSDSTFDDPLRTAAGPQGFYRVRQW